MADPIDFSRFRVPLGSLVLDVALVGALIWSMATMTAKLDEISRRITAVERVEITPEAARRISIIETRETELLRRIDRMENKLDIVIERLPDRVR